MNTSPDQIINDLAKHTHSPQGRFAASDQTYDELLKHIPATQRPVIGQYTASKLPQSRRWTAAAGVLLIVGIGIAGVCYHQYQTHGTTSSPEDVTEPVVGEGTQTLCFDQTPLLDIVAELARVYHVQIEIQNPALADFRITATFSNEEELDIVLQTLAEVGDFTVERRETGYVIR